MLEEPILRRGSQIRTPSGMPVAVFVVEYAIEVQVQNAAALALHDVVPMARFRPKRGQVSVFFRACRSDVMPKI